MSLWLVEEEPQTKSLGLLLQGRGPRVQEAPGHSEWMGGVGGSNPGAARLDIRGLGQLSQAVSRVTGGERVTAA